ALTMTWLGCLAGTVAPLPLAPALLAELSAASTSATLSMVYLGVFPTAVAFATWGYALTRTTAGRLAAATYPAAPLAVLMSWAFLGEVPAPVALVGGALCLTGVLVATLRLRWRCAPRPRPGRGAPIDHVGWRTRCVPHDDTEDAPESARQRPSDDQRRGGTGGGVAGRRLEGL